MSLVEQQLSHRLSRRDFFARGLNAISGGLAIASIVSSCNAQDLQDPRKHNIVAIVGLPSSKWPEAIAQEKRKISDQATETLQLAGKALIASVLVKLAVIGLRRSAF